MQFGLDVKAKVLPIYEKVFDIEFPLPKLDTLVVRPGCVPVFTSLNDPFMTR
jgi:hypothetical protein